MTEEETNAGYDEATQRADGQDQIPTGVDPAEVGLTGAATRPSKRRVNDINMVDNAAEWSKA